MLLDAQEVKRVLPAPPQVPPVPLHRPSWVGIAVPYARLTDKSITSEEVSQPINRGAGVKLPLPDRKR